MLRLPRAVARHARSARGANRRVLAAGADARAWRSGFARLSATAAARCARWWRRCVTWAVYAALLVLRYGAGWRGRRAAYLALAGFALVIAVRLASRRGTSHETSSSSAPRTTTRRSSCASGSRSTASGAAELARELARRRRGRLPLDLQPHGALPRRATTPSAAERRGRGARRARAARSSRALPAARRGGRASPLPRRGRARLDRARRGRDPRPGARRLRGGRAGPVLDRLFRQALHAGKKVRAETAIGESPASVSSAAAALAQQVFGDLEGCRVAARRRGRDGRARRAQPRRARRVDLGGREPGAGARRGARARASARGRPARPARRRARPRGRRRLVDERAGLRARRGDGRAALRAPQGRPLLLIDLAVPRDLDPAIDDLDDCYLYDIDDLEAVVGESLGGRRGEAARAESIVAHEAERFRDWQASLDVVPRSRRCASGPRRSGRASWRKARGRLGGSPRASAARSSR